MTERCLYCSCLSDDGVLVLPLSFEIGATRIDGKSSSHATAEPFFYFFARFVQKQRHPLICHMTLKRV